MNVLRHGYEAARPDRRQVHAALVGVLLLPAVLALGVAVTGRSTAHPTDTTITVTVICSLGLALAGWLWPRLVGSALLVLTAIGLFLWIGFALASGASGSLVTIWIPGFLSAASPLIIVAVLLIWSTLGNSR